MKAKNILYYVYYHSTALESENSKLQDVIQSFPAWAILGPSFFLIQYDASMKEEDAGVNLEAIRKKIDAVCGPRDYYFIGRMGDLATWKGYGTNLKAWLINNAIPTDMKSSPLFSLQESAHPAQGRHIKTASSSVNSETKEDKNMKKE